MSFMTDYSNLKPFSVETLAGIMFYDITTLLLDPEAFKDTIDLFVERYKDKQISVVAGSVSPYACSFFFLSCLQLITIVSQRKLLDMLKYISWV